MSACRLSVEHPGIGHAYLYSISGCVFSGWVLRGSVCVQLSLVGSLGCGDNTERLKRMNWSLSLPMSIGPPFGISIILAASYGFAQFHTDRA